MGLGSFVNINIFVIKYYFFLVCLYISIFSNLLNVHKKLRPQKGNSGVLFNDTLLYFGLQSKCRTQKKKNLSFSLILEQMNERFEIFVLPLQVLASLNVIFKISKTSFHYPLRRKLIFVKIYNFITILNTHIKVVHNQFYLNIKTQKYTNFNIIIKNVFKYIFCYIFFFVLST